MTDAVRLTSLSHGGGCGCKIAPGVLSEILTGQPAAAAFPKLLVGIETADDAAVYQLNDEQALIATTDFFMPIVDDPFDFGRIAATNAMSDVYAMGGRPIMALALVGMPIGKLPVETIGKILRRRGGLRRGRHPDRRRPHDRFGRADLRPGRRWGWSIPSRCAARHREGGRRAGPGQAARRRRALGALKKERSTRRLRGADRHHDPAQHARHRAGRHGRRARDDRRHRLRPAGHALEICRGAGLSVEIEVDEPALLPGVEALARQGVRTGAAVRNWASYGEAVRLPAELADWRRDILCDPQTSGGLLVAVAAEKAQAALDLVRSRGFAGAAVVGRMVEGAPGITVTF